MSEPAAFDPLDRLAAERQRPAASRREFHAQLAAVATTLVDLGSAVADSIVPVTSAFVEGDAAAAADYRATDDRIRAGCADLEDACYLLLARQSPVAGDLRRVVAAIRSITHVERASNLLAHIAGALAWVHPPAMPERLREVLRQLGAEAAKVYAGAVRAWREDDALAAAELERADDQVDLLQKVLLTELYTGDQSTEESISLALLARYFERLGDHGVDLARQVSYAVAGARTPTDT